MQTLLASLCLEGSMKRREFLGALAGAASAVTECARAGKIEAEFTKQSRCFDYCLAKRNIK